MDLSNYTNMRDICGMIPQGNHKQAKKFNLKELERERSPEVFHLAVSVKETEAAVIISYQEEHNQSVYCRLFDPEDRLVAEQAMEAGEATFILKDPQLWSPQTPRLYTLLIITEAKQYFYQTGIYEQTIENGRLFVNHTWYPVVGVRGCDTAATEAGELAEASVRLQMVRMRENGINTIFLEREKEYPCWVAEIAEEAGILLLWEGEIEGANVPAWKDYYHILEQVNEIYEALKVLLWTQE